MTYKLSEFIRVKYFGVGLGDFCHHIFYDFHSLYITLLILAIPMHG